MQPRIPPTSGTAAGAGMARRRPRRNVRDYYRRVADTLIEQIERGTASWTKAWKPGGKALPYNVKTGRTYTGGNALWLQGTADRRGYADERWGTYKQVQELGGHVRRGQKGCSILFWQFETKRLVRDERNQPVLDDSGRPVYETKPLPRPRVYQYTVFNAEQCAGLPPRPQRAGSHQWNRHEEAERVIKASGAVLEHLGKDEAYYDLRRDRIILPFKEEFPNGPSYYQTALHELGHWTGHPSRLNRETLVNGLEEGSESRAYAREELRAEISSMMTGDRLDIGHDPSRHAAYVGGWVKNLKEEPQEIYRAAKDAQDMSNYLLDRVRGRDINRTSRAAQMIPAGLQRGQRSGDERPPGPPEPPRIVPVRRKPIVLPWQRRTPSRERPSGPER